MGASLHTDDDIPAVRGESLALDRLAVAFAESALLPDQVGVVGHTQVRDLDILLGVVAAEDACVVRAAVAPAPASAGLVSEGSVALHAAEVLDAILYGIDAGVEVC